LSVSVYFCVGELYRQPSLGLVWPAGDRACSYRDGTTDWNQTSKCFDAIVMRQRDELPAYTPRRRCRKKRYQCMPSTVYGRLSDFVRRPVISISGDPLLWQLLL